jgi:6-pyruvoyltetrahydropterin/6-carboxytetrahydropterin synthase
MYVDRVEISFDAGHRILGHPGKCAAPHGHTYRAEVYVSAPEVDALGFARDFGDVKGPLKAWIDHHWDHAFLVGRDDTALLAALGSLADAKIYRVALGNPSAELLARELFDVAADLLDAPVDAVRVWESPTQWAEYRPRPPVAGVHG